MKISIALLTGTLLAFASCSKSDTKPNSSTTGSPYSMTATIGSTPFSRDSCVFTQGLVDTTTVEIVGWAGYPTTGPNYYPQIYIYLTFVYHGIGTYSFSGPSGGYATLLTDSSEIFSTGGSVSITSTYPNVVGTFSFTLASGIAVSNGSFTALRN
jgi:hypothetical protein